MILINGTASQPIADARAGMDLSEPFSNRLAA